MSSHTLGHGFTTRSESALHLTRMKLLEIADSSQHEDFLSLLSLIQLLEVEILPLVWYPALHVGMGGFAVLNQAPVNKQTSFIFKRLRDPKTLNSKESPRSFSSSMAEIAILNHHNIKTHPNVLDFYGICWEVSPITDQILPVLVLEKAKYGDLFAFRNSPEGKNLSVNTKLRLCFQIANGLAMLHASLIIHGDIKPDNILICEGGQGELIAKIADFGSSRAGQTEEDMYELHESPTWSAPEHHHREVSIFAAKKMDIYSFSLVCLWLLLDKSHGATDGVSAAAIIQQMKGTNNILTRARDLVNSLDLGSASSIRLVHLLQSNLAIEPLERVLDLQAMAELMSLDQENVVMVYKGSPVCRDISHITFKISHNLYALTQGNYLVRILIFQSFEHKANHSKCKKCKRRAAFELAFCYYIGFGTASDHQRAKFWAHKAGKKKEDLEDEKDEVIDYLLYPNPVVNDLRKHAFSMIMDHANEYRRPDYDINMVLDFLQREIHDLDGAFDGQFMLTTTLRGVVASVYLGAGRTEDAERVYRELVDFFEQSPDHGLTHSDTLSSQQRLAEILRQGGKLGAAEKLARRCLANRTRTEQGITAEIIECKSTLGSILFDAGLFEEAIELFTDVSRESTNLLGPEHPQTLFGSSNLACAYRASGLLNEAQNLDLMVLRIKERTLDNECHAHFSTVTSAANLASTYSCQGRWDKAEAIELWVVQERSSSLGEHHPVTLLAKEQLAETYRQQGRLEYAKAVLETKVQSASTQSDILASRMKRPEWG